MEVKNKARISVLITVYKTERPNNLHRALESIWVDQILKPDEVVLVEDGELPVDLLKVIDDWQKMLNEQFVRVVLPENVGLGNALRIGIMEVNNELVARMDTDDISLPTRFERQIDFLTHHPEVDIVGTQIMEFVKDETDLKNARRLPLLHLELVEFSKLRCPFNHPSVMFRKSSYLKAATKQNIFHQDDYATWVNFIINGFILSNLPSVELLMRAGRNQMDRRGGLKYFIDEIKMIQEFKNCGFLSITDYYKSIIVRFPVRMSPRRLRYILYQFFIRS